MVYFAPQLPSSRWLVREALAEGHGYGLKSGRSPVPGSARGGGAASSAPGSEASLSDAASGVSPSASIPDPLDDVDALEELEEEITTLAAHIHAATHRLLVLIAEFDRRRGWELGGHRSCAHWLSFRTGIDLGAAREKVRTARALAGLPGISEAMARGELSFSKVRALTRVANRDNEGDLLDFARNATTAQLERMVRAVRRGSAKDEAAWEKECYESRTLSVFPDDDPGMVVVRGRLPAEMGALVMRAIEAASDALYREEGPAWLAQYQEEEESQKKAAQRRADALALLAERALAVGFGGGGNGDGEEAGERGGPHGRRETGEGGDFRTEGGSGDAESSSASDSAGCCCDSSHPEHPVPISGTRAERYQVVLHVEAETLEGETLDSGGGFEVQGEYEAGVTDEEHTKFPRSELEDGARVSAETSRRLSCDVGVVKVSHGPDGSILDVGRKTRTIPPALRRALEYRDRGCRFPGCGLRFTDGHHVKHWADGGETKLENLVLLCRYHHRLVHEEGWKVDWWGEGRPVFFDPRGGTHFDGRWKWPTKGRSRAPEDSPNGSAETLMANKRAQGVEPYAGGQVDRSQPEKSTRVSAETLLQDNRARGVRPHAWTASAKWKREEDIPTEAASKAWEAMLPG
jgi:hypothetical protein